MDLSWAASYFSYPLFSRIEEEGGLLVFPAQFEERMLGWLGGDLGLLEEAAYQTVIQVVGRSHTRMLLIKERLCKHRLRQDQK